MPYINKETRDHFSKIISLDGLSIETAGDLNYLITQLIDNYIAHHGLSYRTLNTIIGAVECAKMELYRRVAAPYEDVKIKENGDVYKQSPSTDEVWNYFPLD